MRLPASANPRSWEPSPRASRRQAPWHPHLQNRRRRSDPCPNSGAKPSACTLARSPETDLSRSSAAAGSMTCWSSASQKRTRVGASRIAPITQPVMHQQNNLNTTPFLLPLLGEPSFKDGKGYCPAQSAKRRSEAPTKGPGRNPSCKHQCSGPSLCGFVKAFLMASYFSR